MLKADLSAYLERINFEGDCAPTLATLAAVLERHTASIPFENFDVLLGRGIRLDLESLQNKLVRDRRGGYCFEHATLMGAVLDELGFDVRRHAARVVFIAPRDRAPRTHMFLTVALPDGTFAVDPGFGGFSSRVPIPMEPNRKVGSGTDKHWFERDGRYWVLKVQRGDQLFEGWISTLEEENAIDFELGNHYTATYPGTVMSTIIMASAVTPKGRVSLMNRDVTLHEDGTVSNLQLADRAALRSFLREHFGFDLPQVETMRVPAIPEWD